MLGLVLLAALPAHAATVEEIFAAARNYTVYVETRIETPFIEDDAGSYLGAGFIVDRERGWVMTNAHVIGHSPATLDVSFSDGAKSKATPVYIDSFLDLAVIELEPGTTDSREQAQLDCASHPAVGVPVGAYGHPNGYRFSGTRGIVSGFSSLAGSASLQTDAPINGGNSGGPLIRLDTGTVVGINTQSLVGDHVQNMNFAVETVYACRVLQLLRQGQDPRPAALDALFYIEDGEPTLTVSHVGPRAANAELRAGDRIVAVGDAVIEPDDLAELMHRLRGVRGSVELQVKRTGGEVAALHYPIVPDDAVLSRRGFFLAGALFAPTLFEDAGLLTDQPKLMVHFVARGSAAESAGLAPFDQLIGVNGRPVDDVDQLARLARAASADRAEIDVIRLAPQRQRFTRHIKASLPLDHASWVALRPHEAAAPLGAEPLPADTPTRVDIASTHRRID
jgi:S1-C subfamily serine protease